MTFFLEGRLDSNTALAQEKEMLKALKKKTIDRLLLDCTDLVFITSAGLRVILTLWKKYPCLSIVETSQEIYDIFEITGFTRMIDVRHCLREIDVTGLPLVGEGFTANVYRLDAETIVKVFKKDRSIDDVRLEIDSAKKAFIHGIPTAISFDIVRVGEKLGLVFEMLNCSSLRDLIVQHPENFDHYKKMYADLSYRITHTHAEDSDLAHCKEPLLKKLSLLETVMKPDEYAKLIGMIRALPETETLTHGDFHIKNILVQGDEPILIDMDAVALGHPIFELEGIYLSAKAYNVAQPGNASEFFGVPQETIDALYDALIKTYFPEKNEEELRVICEKIELFATAHLAYQAIRYNRDVNGRLQKALARLGVLLKRYDDLDILQ